MIYIQKTTADERGLIIDAVSPIMSAVENAKDLLSDIESEYFEAIDPKLDEYAVKRISLVVRVAGDMLFDACTAFGLLTGFDCFGNPQCAREQMKQIFRSQRVDKLNDQLCDKERHMGEEKKKCSIAARSKAHEMPDEQAEMVLSALLKEV